MMDEVKSAFVTIVGRSNVGKSTILNRLVGEKVAIISEKPQTTRNKITGILSNDKYQIVFIDTPGIQRPKNKLGKYMNKVANESMKGVDIILFVVDVSRPRMSDYESDLIESFKDSKRPVILILNKIDLIKKSELLPIIDEYSNLYNFETVIPVSAKENEGVELITREIINRAKKGPKYFPDDMVTDQPERHLIAEIIREKILDKIEKEVPHGIAVEIESIKNINNSETLDIMANIYCEKKSHKGIIIGNKGSMLKTIGTNARTEIENLLGNKVYLQLWVKVKKDWRNSDIMIKNFGFK